MGVILIVVFMLLLAGGAAYLYVRHRNRTEKSKSDSKQVPLMANDSLQPMAQDGMYPNGGVEIPLTTMNSSGE
jgi:hypothetical protein